MTTEHCAGNRGGEGAMGRGRVGRLVAGLAGALAWMGAVVPAGAAGAPVVSSILLQNGNLVISATVPTGYRHAVLEAGDTVVQASRESLVAGALNGAAGVVTFRVPDPRAPKFLRIRLGTDEAVPAATLVGAAYYSVEYGGGGVLSPGEKAGHVLNRLAYGPTAEDLALVDSIGVSAFIDRQLAPAGIDESSNRDLNDRVGALFTTLQPAEDTRWVAAGDAWRYFKGTQAPPAGWAQLVFNDSGWLEGPTGIGYGDDDDATELADMRQQEGQAGYHSVFLRKRFSADSVADLDGLILRVDFDDGFVAYLNGTEVARENMTGANPAFNVAASGDHEAGTPVDIDLSAHRGLLKAGENVLAIQVHNSSLTSSDLSMIPELIGRRLLPLPPQRRILGITELQQLVHVRGIYARRQLQAVLGEFWENHFTTDYDKVAEYLANLRNSDARPAMTEAQAAEEAAQMEYEEYQFFHDNALGNFGDLLLYSATSPAQLIYLDNVLNVKGAPNENYAREILELFGFGVDNRYTQTDIEQLARCFTGWNIRKVWPDQKQAFPASARNPPTAEGVQYEDSVLMDLGPGWKYFKGTQEPTPGATNGPGTAWTLPGFVPTGWLDGATGIGFGDGDDATVLADMRNQYVSVYLRKEFTVADPAALGNLLLSVDYDDGFVAYLNGTEVARSSTMRGTGTPPPFGRVASGSHEAGGAAEAHGLGEFRHLLKAAPEKNVLAIQAHNISRDSSDLSILPRLVVRRNLPGSIENGDRNGVWTFRFNPDRHDTTAKNLFTNTPLARTIPAGRTGTNGLLDAVEVVDSFVDHPSTSEFICLKLVNRFVSDEITLQSFHAGTAPEPLRRLLDDAIQAWHSTRPAGNIATVMRAILRPATQDGLFWARENYRAKVKTPVEFINSSVRALRANVSGTTLPAKNDDLGMHLFTRDEPDGWSESGLDWIDTGTMLSRMQFARALASDGVGSVRWDVSAWLAANRLGTAESIVDYFDRVLFHGGMASSNRSLLVRFATTDDAGKPLPLDPGRSDYQARVRELVGIILAMPQWHYQ